MKMWIIHQLYGDMTIENYGSVCSIDHTYPHSKTNWPKEKDIYKYTHWNILGAMFSSENNSKKAYNWLLSIFPTGNWAENFSKIK